MDKYREYLPQSWLAFIDRDPVLAAAFSAHKYACDSEPVAPFLFQDLRGGKWSGCARFLPCTASRA